MPIRRDTVLLPSNWRELVMLSPAKRRALDWVEKIEGKMGSVGEGDTEALTEREVGEEERMVLPEFTFREAPGGKYGLQGGCPALCHIVLLRICTEGQHIAVANPTRPARPLQTKPCLRPGPLTKTINFLSLILSYFGGGGQWRLAHTRGSSHVQQTQT